MTCNRNCNQGPTCPARRAGGRTCDELGVCQALPGCACEGGVRHDADRLPPGGFWFSPGSLDGPYSRTVSERRTRRLSVGLYLVVIGLALAGTLAFASGWVSVAGLLP